MVFSSYTFIFLFLPLVLAVYYCSPNRLKNYFLLVASLFFYAWGASEVILLLVFSSVVDYLLSLKFNKLVASGEKAKAKKIFILALILNLTFLFYFKYFTFFIGEFANLLLEIGWQIPVKQVALPIGVSFFIFQKISYLADVYQGKTKPASSFTDYLLFVSLFPQLIAGPIVKYNYIEAEIKNRLHSSDKFFAGIIRFSSGLFKKVCIADMLALTANKMFTVSPDQLDVFQAWSGLLAYSLQIYFDFSGYSDMAIGLGLMFGFTLPENFNRPYLAKSFTEFWRRWHLTLSSWMKEYLYIPLGGNRVSTKRVYFNLWLVFLLSGLWHGANWTFVLWGCYHGAFIVLDKLFVSQVIEKTKFNWLFVPLNVFFIMLAWVLFRADNLGHAINYYQALFGLNSSEPVYYLASVWNNRGIATLILALIICFTPFKIRTLLTANNFSLTKTQQLSLGSLSLLLFYLAISFLTLSSYSPFLYFKF